jgi:hypothetical protein
MPIYPFGGPEVTAQTTAWGSVRNDGPLCPQAAAVSKPSACATCGTTQQRAFARNARMSPYRSSSLASDIKSVMRYVDIGGKEASRLTGRIFDCRRSVAEVLHKI